MSRLDHAQNFPDEKKLQWITGEGIKRVDLSRRQLQALFVQLA